ncbi:hypothetical protein D3C86_1312870 [compost metagenome]
MRHEGVGEAGLGLQVRNGGGPLVRHHRRHGVAALGDLDRRLHQVFERQLAELLVQRGPAGHHARHGDRIPAADRPIGEAVAVHAVLVLEVFGVPGGRGHARRVQAMQFLAVPEDREGVATQAARHRLHQRDGGSGGDGRIDGIAALEQHAQAGLCRQRVRGGDHVAREQRNAHGGVGVGPVEVLHGLSRFSPPESCDP